MAFCPTNFFRLTRLLAVCAVALATPPALAQGGHQHGGGIADMAQAQCAQMVGRFHVQMVAYQAQSANFDAYCAELPDVGATAIAFDLIDEELRKIPIAVRVVKAKNGQAGADALVDIAAKTYPLGVIEVRLNLAERGEYAAILLVQDHHPLISQFPIKVGRGIDLTLPLVVVAVLAAVGGLYFTLGRNAVKTPG